MFRMCNKAKDAEIASEMKSRLMYIELKTDSVRGPARIGRVAFSKTGRSLYYAGRTFARVSGRALKANYFDTQTSEEFWISGPRADGRDSLYATTVAIDEDARKEYWRDVRGMPAGALRPSYKSPGKSKQERDALEKAARRRNMDRRWQPARFEAGRESTVEERDADEHADEL
jgi:hypothetical protein